MSPARLITLKSGPVYALTLASIVILLLLSVAAYLGRYPRSELATHFRLQYALGATLLLVIFAVQRDWLLVVLALSCAAYNWSLIVPFYNRRPDLSSGPVERQQVRLMLANVEWSNRAFEKALDSIKDADADIVILQEVTDEWWDHLRPLTAHFPYNKVESRQGGSGLVVLSRFPLQNAEALAIDQSTHPIMIVTAVDLNGEPFTILTMHPPTPVRRRKFDFRNGQFAKAAEMMRGMHGPKVLIGDLNITPWSPYFTDLVRESGLRDVRRETGLLPSWPMPLPGLFRIPLDHCLVSNDIAVQGARLGKRTGSDHLPLVVELALPPGVDAAQHISR